MEPSDDDKRFAHRKAQYKKTVDEEGARRKREENLVRLGKAKKEEQQTKRRQAFVAEASSAAPASVAAPAPAVRMPAIADIPYLMSLVQSADEMVQLDGVSQFRRLLSREDHPPIDRVVELGLVHMLVRLLASRMPRLQFESAWALTNIASGSSANTEAVVAAGAVPVLVSLLQSPDIDVREQAVWACGNIAGDSPICRDAVLQAGALEGVLQHVGPDSKLSCVRTTTWAISNFLRGKPAPPLVAVAAAVPMLAQLIYSEDTDTLVDALWALCYLTDADEPGFLHMAVETGVCRRVAELLLHTNIAVQTPALRTVGNIIAGDEIQTQVMINAGALRSLDHVLEHSRRGGLKKEACWAVSNVMAGTKEQVQAACDAGLIMQMVRLIDEAHLDIRREACWAISNSTSGGTPQQILFLIQRGAVGALAAMLANENPQIALVALEGLENLLRAGEVLESPAVRLLAEGAVRNLCERNGVPDLLHEILTDDPLLLRKAASVMKSWFVGWDPDMMGEGPADYAESDDEVEEEGQVSYDDGAGGEDDLNRTLLQAGPAGGGGGGYPAPPPPVVAQPMAAAAAVNSATGQFQFGAAAAGGGGGWGGGGALGSAFASAAPLTGAPPAAPAPGYSFSGMQFQR